MSELLNKYIEQHSLFLDELVRYHKLHLEFMDRQSPRRTGNLRKSLKRMRIAIKNMETLSQQRMKERSEEYIAMYPKKTKLGRSKT